MYHLAYARHTVFIRSNRKYFVDLLTIQKKYFGFEIYSVVKQDGVYRRFFMDWLQTLDWKFIIGDIFIPIITFVIGLFIGKDVEKKKEKSTIKGNSNIVIQNSDIHK